jgi:hypothetical protein
MSDNDVAGFVALCVFGLPTLGWIVSRMLKHRERMEMLRHGMMPPGDEARWGPGFAAPRAAAPPAYGSQPSAWNMNAQAGLRKGIVTTAIGVALLIGLSFIGYHQDGTFTLGPWLLGGLIPMFVGLAGIANALLSGAQFPRQNVQMGPIPPPPPPNQAAPPSGPYTYRPGSTEELPRTKPPQAQ